MKNAWGCFGARARVPAVRAVFLCDRSVGLPLALALPLAASGMQLKYFSERWLLTLLFFFCACFAFPDVARGWNGWNALSSNYAVMNLFWSGRNVYRQRNSQVTYVSLLRARARVPSNSTLCSSCRIVWCDDCIAVVFFFVSPSALWSVCRTCCAVMHVRLYASCLILSQP